MEKMDRFSEQDYAPLWKRVIAVLIDTVIIIAFLYALLLLKGSNSSPLILVYLFFVWLIPMAYFIISEALYGQTIGKKAMGIMVVGENKKRVGFRESFLRNVIRIVDVLPVFYILGGVLVLLTSKNQRFGDWSAKTIVIQKQGRVR